MFVSRFLLLSEFSVLDDNIRSSRRCCCCALCWLVWHEGSKNLCQLLSFCLNRIVLQSRKFDRLDKRLQHSFVSLSTLCRLRVCVCVCAVRASCRTWRSNTCFVFAASTSVVLSLLLLPPLFSHSLCFECLFYFTLNAFKQHVDKTTCANNRKFSFLCATILQFYVLH